MIPIQSLAISSSFGTAHITESLLFYIWKFKYYDCTKLLSTHQERIEIIDCGIYNTNSGPDFSMAKIKINDTVWVGNIEIHTQASHWYQHQHEKDTAYNNVILHVVWEHDLDIKNSLGHEIPTLVLGNIVDASLLNRYQSLMLSQDWVLCEKHIIKIKDLTKNTWLSRLAAERLEQKSKYILSRLKNGAGDWEQITYQAIARALGSQVNGESMEQLTRSTPLALLLKHKDQLFQIEALLYGQSGLLDPIMHKEEYPLKLGSEYQFLQSKYALSPMNTSAWKFLRMRPANFPTIRIAQLARLYHQTDHLFSKLLSCQNIQEVQNLFDITVSQYWKNHYTFQRESIARNKKLGTDTIHHIAINTLAPLLFAYGIATADESYKEKAIDWLAELPSEKNQITASWAGIGWESKNAMDSQALIQLKTKYCDEKKCLECSIGHKIMKGNF